MSPILDKDLLEQAQANNGELPESYLPSVELPLRFKALGILERLYNLSSALVNIMIMLFLFGLAISVCCGLIIFIGWITSDSNTSSLNPVSEQNSIPRAPNATATPFPTQVPLVLTHYSQDNPHPLSVPCEITNLSSKPVAIYAAPDRAERIDLFEQSETLRIVGDGNQKWYEVELEDGFVGWFYYQDTYYDAVYCEE